MKILYFGESGVKTQSGQQAEVLQCLGHELQIHDPNLICPSTSSSATGSRSGEAVNFRRFQMSLVNWLHSLDVAGGKFELVWIQGGDWFGEECLKYIRTLGAPVVLYHDSPIGMRNGLRWETLEKAAAHADLCVAGAQMDLAEFTGLGCRHLLKASKDGAGTADTSLAGAGGDFCRQILEHFDVTAQPTSAGLTGKLKILYFGTSNSVSTCYHRAMALKRLGHEVRIADPLKSSRPFLVRLDHRTGFRFHQPRFLRWLQELKVSPGDYDVIWVDSGEFFGEKCVAFLRTLAKNVVLYNLDDPTGPRDGHRFDNFKKAVHLYDLCVTVRKKTAHEFHQLGVTRLLRLWRSYDEVDHRPFEKWEEIPAEFRSEVVFVGTWMRHENRDKFLLHLIKSGVPVSIWGDRWHKSPLWAELRAHVRGGNIWGRNYVAALQGAKICIGLLSKGNRDWHTQRSLEVTFAGGLFCAERTADHLELYQDGHEAVFWSSPEECAAKCHELLNNPEYRDGIRQAGMRRIRELKVGNEDVCRTVLNHLIF